MLIYMWVMAECWASDPVFRDLDQSLTRFWNICVYTHTHTSIQVCIRHTHHLIEEDGKKNEGQLYEVIRKMLGSGDSL